MGSLVRVDDKNIVGTSKSDEADVTIQLAIESIQNNNEEDLELLISRIPVERIPVETSNALLSGFLDQVAKYGKKKCIPIILNRWEDTFLINDKISIITQIFLTNIFQRRTLAYIVQNVEDTTFGEIVDELIDYDESPEVETACARLIEAYGEQDRSIYEILADEATSRGNSVVRDFMIAKIEENPEMAPIPSWMKNFYTIDGAKNEEGEEEEGEEDTNKITCLIPLESELEIPEENPIQREIPNDEIAADLLTSGLQDQGVSFEDLEEAREVIRAKLAILPLSDKLALLEPIFVQQDLAALQDDDNLFQLLGPANPMLGANSDGLKYGGCRMFICDVYDYDEEEEEVVDWFRGVCDQCHKGIRIRWHAVRMPKPAGGWKGCYCSWECVRQDVPDFYSGYGGKEEGREEEKGEKGEEEEERERISGNLTLTMIDEVEESFDLIGIQDRIPDGDPEKYPEGVAARNACIDWLEQQ